MSNKHQMDLLIRASNGESITSEERRRGIRSDELHQEWLDRQGSHEASQPSEEELDAVIDHLRSLYASNEAIRIRVTVLEGAMQRAQASIQGTPDEVDRMVDTKLAGLKDEFSDLRASAWQDFALFKAELRIELLEDVHRAGCYVYRACLALAEHQKLKGGAAHHQACLLYTVDFNHAYSSVVAQFQAAFDKLMAEEALQTPGVSITKLRRSTLALAARASTLTPDVLEMVQAVQDRPRPNQPPQPPAIDYEIARALEDGSERVYPGLGVIPSSAELAGLIGELRELRNAPKPICNSADLLEGRERAVEDWELFAYGCWAEIKDQYGQTTEEEERQPSLQ